MNGLLKSVLAGAIGAALVVAASAALAGNGVGGVFNLGAANTVDATSFLSGTTSGSQLKVTNLGSGSGAQGTSASPTAAGVYGSNTAGGPGLQASVKAGTPPLKVNSSTRVTYLNADRLDGIHANGLARAARMTTQGFMTLIEDTSQAYGPPISITVPQDGLVLANASVTVRNSTCTSGCIAAGQIRHVQTGERSTPMKTTLPSAASEAMMAGLGMSYVFEVSAGVHSFDVQLHREGMGNGSIVGWYGEMNALYVPFGPTGGSTLGASPRPSRRR